MFLSPDTSHPLMSRCWVSCIENLRWNSSFIIFYCSLACGYSSFSISTSCDTGMRAYCSSALPLPFRLKIVNPNLLFAF